MRRLKRILLASNLSPHSDRAMERAVALALRHGAELSVVHAQPPNPADSETPIDRLEPPDAKREILRHLETFMPSSELPVFIHCARGEVAEVVADYAKSWMPDLKVAGIRQKGAFDDLLTASTLESICAFDAIPLLAVRNKPFGPYLSALAAVDFSPLSKRVVEAALTLSSDGPLSLLHVCDLPGLESQPGAAGGADFAQEFSELLEGLDTAERYVGTRVVYGATVASLVRLAEVEPPDIAVLGTAARTGIGRLLVGSVAHQALEQMACDVLLVPSED